MINLENSWRFNFVVFERKSESSYEAVQPEYGPHEVTIVSLADPIETLYNVAHSVIAESLAAEDLPGIYYFSLHEVRGTQNLCLTPREPLTGEEGTQRKIRGIVGDVGAGIRFTAKENGCPPRS